MSFLHPVFILACIALSFGCGGCGYGFQRTQKPIFGKQEIARLYVEPLVNNTFKPGIENLVYNALVKKLSLQKNLPIVAQRADADAVLKGVVNNAIYIGAGAADASQLSDNAFLPPERRFRSSVTISTEYAATLNCTFKLLHYNDESKVLWIQGFNQTKKFPGSNRLDVFGTTSTQVNESEFDRALGDLAEGMMNDLYESLFWRF